MKHPLSINVTFSGLSKNPFSSDYLASLKEHFSAIRKQSKDAMLRVLLLMVIAGGLFVMALSEEAYASLALIDWLLLVVILGCTGFIIWGVIDDRLFERHNLSIRINGVEYARRIHESMRKNPTLFDKARVDDIPINRDNPDIHRFIYSVIDSKHRPFTGLDRVILQDNRR